MSTIANAKSAIANAKSTMASTDAWLQQLFAPISLGALNAKAEMLDRLDNKYVVEADVLRSAAAELARHFDILEIDGRRAFHYETCYFDDANRRSYFEHHQGRLRRAKVRIRKYNAELCFLEVKLKDKRGATVKKRLRYDPAKYGTLDQAALAYVHSAYYEQYGQDFPCDELSRILDTHYFRTTLVAKQGGERMTIDSELRFLSPGSSHAVEDGLFILEAKSANGNGIADRILRALHQHSILHCSKYCTAIAVLHQGTKHNNFLPGLRKLRSVPAPGLSHLRSMPAPSEELAAWSPDLQWRHGSSGWAPATMGQGVVRLQRGQAS